MYLWTTVAILHKISLVSWWLRSAVTGHSLSNPFVIHFSRVFKTCTGLMSSFINVSTVIRWNKNISKSFILISKCAKHLIYEMTCIQLPSSIEMEFLNKEAFWLIDFDQKTLQSIIVRWILFMSLTCIILGVIFFLKRNKESFL